MVGTAGPATVANSPSTGWRPAQPWNRGRVLPHRVAGGQPLHLVVLRLHQPDLSPHRRWVNARPDEHRRGVAGDPAELRYSGRLVGVGHPGSRAGHRPGAPECTRAFGRSAHGNRFQWMASCLHQTSKAPADRRTTRPVSVPNSVGGAFPKNHTCLHARSLRQAQRIRLTFLAILKSTGPGDFPFVR